jgi:hypothetical protein
VRGLDGPAEIAARFGLHRVFLSLVQVVMVARIAAGGGSGREFFFSCVPKWDAGEKDGKRWFGLSSFPSAPHVSDKRPPVKPGGAARARVRYEPRPGGAGAVPAGTARSGLDKGAS